MENVTKITEIDFYKKMINQIDIEDFECNCKGILCDVHIKVDENPLIWRSKIYLDDILPDRGILIDGNLHFIKSVKLNKEGHCVHIKTYIELEIENLYKSYLEKNLEYELPNDEYATFYPVDGIDYNDLYSKGLNINLQIKVDIYSYEQFKDFLNEYGLNNYLYHYKSNDGFKE